MGKLLRLLLTMEYFVNSGNSNEEIVQTLIGKSDLEFYRELNQYIHACREFDPNGLYVRPLQVSEASLINYGVILQVQRVRHQITENH